MSICYSQREFLKTSSALLAGSLLGEAAGTAGTQRATTPPNIVMILAGPTRNKPFDSRVILLGALDFCFLLHNSIYRMLWVKATGQIVRIGLILILTNT